MISPSKPKVPQKSKNPKPIPHASAPYYFMRVLNIRS